VIPKSTKASEVAVLLLLVLYISAEPRSQKVEPNYFRFG
jgi:hypothetical protein